MATDLETGTDQGEPALARPSLKITGLHIRGLKSIGSLDLPADGLGWDGPIPDMLMVGGINGSGKTTLLEFLAAAFEQMSSPLPDRQIVNVPAKLRASGARVDFWLDCPGLGGLSIRFLIGNSHFIRENVQATWLGLQYTGQEVGESAAFVGEKTNDLRVFQHHVTLKSDLSIDSFGPAVVYFPSERRTPTSPPANYKSAGKMSDRHKFVDRWAPPEKWDDSLEARLYAVRWADLNAKEDGRPEEATRFRSYQIAFDRFFEGRKRIKWTSRGELVVETKNGDIHDLSELSSGEKQIILFMGELLHRWQPGSLILIDEPELHLHESYQTRLWQSMVDWQKERGGQVIVTTQSDHLFGISDPGIKVLLSVRRGRCVRPI